MGMFTHPYGQCAQCGVKIVEYDDDAHVCIKCGGRNRALEPQREYLPGGRAWFMLGLLAAFSAIVYDWLKAH